MRWLCEVTSDEDMWCKDPSCLASLCGAPVVAWEADSVLEVSSVGFCDSFYIKASILVVSIPVNEATKFSAFTCLRPISTTLSKFYFLRISWTAR